MPGHKKRGRSISGVDMLFWRRIINLVSVRCNVQDERTGCIVAVIITY